MLCILDVVSVCFIFRHDVAFVRFFLVAVLLYKARRKEGCKKARKQARQQASKKRTWSKEQRYVKIQNAQHMFNPRVRLVELDTCL